MILIRMFNNSVFQRILNLVAPASRKLGIEKFVDAAAAAVGSTETTTSTTAATSTTTSPVTGAAVPAESDSKGSGLIWLILSLLLTIAFIIAYSAGAARLSWCYNKSLGTDTGLAIFYAFLAYSFAGFYYPYYGLFVNPVCSLRATPATIGGRRRH